ncbi:penicillin-binding transpeptidase domain-containing protein [Bdellovibrionota bacterium FG-2]
MKLLSGSKVGAFFIFVLVCSTFFFAAGALKSKVALDSGSLPQKGSSSLLSKDKVAQAIGESATFYRFPTQIDLPPELHPALSKLKGSPVTAQIQYSFDPKLQTSLEGLLRSYSPDYGALVVLDANTGRVLSMVSSTQHKEFQGNLALQATFPSASIFKVVTAAAAIEHQKFSAETMIPFNGRNHTLYRGNILKNQITRWTRYTSLKTAFAKSINTVFGKIGAYDVGHQELQLYADRFGFNHRISSDLPVETGRAVIPQDAWGMAEAASGYTRANTMSPLQGALMAAAIVNEGVMMEPYIVQSVSTMEGESLYVAEPEVALTSVDPKTAAEMRELMRETISQGTSKKSFRKFFKGEYALLDVGGKTGSLTGDQPKGKYDWFVGFAEGGSHRIAVAALTIHGKLWKVKSSVLARKVIESYFHGKLTGKHVAGR